MSTTVYLLFQWTDEREAKSHIGIYSSIEKAKAAAQLDCNSEAKQHHEPAEELAWATGAGDLSAIAWWHENEDDGLYDIESFELDVYNDYSDVVWGVPGDSPEGQPKEIEL
jgi:hypothetical protein